MSNALDKIIDLLTEARKAATLENASFGFPNDRIEVKSVHFGDDRTGRVGDVLHPDEYVKKLVDLHHGSWIIGPIDRALGLLKLHVEIIERADELAKALDKVGFARLVDLVEKSQGPSVY